MKVQDFMVAVFMLYKSFGNAGFNVIYIPDCFAEIPDHIAFLKCAVSVRLGEKVIIKFCVIIGKEITGNQHMVHLPFVGMVSVYHKLMILPIGKREGEWITRN